MYVAQNYLKLAWHLAKNQSLCLLSNLLLLFSHQVLYNSLWLLKLQHVKLPCPSLSPWVCSNPCPLSQWCHPTISSSVNPFSSCPQSFLASGSFPVNQLFASGGQSVGVSASASVLPMYIQDWLPLGWTGLLSFPNLLAYWVQHFHSIIF